MNHHASHPAQAHAADIVALGPGGFRAEGLPRATSSATPSTGRRRQPLPGPRLRHARRPARPDPARGRSGEPAGNDVVLACGGLEVELAHLSPGTIAVSPASTSPSARPSAASATPATPPSRTCTCTPPPPRPAAPPGDARGATPPAAASSTAEIAPFPSPSAPPAPSASRSAPQTLVSAILFRTQEIAMVSRVKRPLSHLLAGARRAPWPSAERLVFAAEST